MNLRKKQSLLRDPEATFTERREWQGTEQSGKGPVRAPQLGLDRGAAEEARQ